MSTISNEYIDNSQQSVFSAALPYAVGSLAVGAAGTWLAVANITAVTAATAGVPVGAAVLATAGAISALMGFYCFLATTVTGIYSRNSAEFYRNIGPALKLASVAVITEVLATTARMVLEKVINKVLFGNRP